MEGPGRLRRKTATPVPMGVFRDGGCSPLAPALRQPRTSERTWWRRAMGSLWGSLDHQKCSTIPRDGSGDPRPAFVVGSSPVVTTVESVKGALVLSRRSSDCSDWPARAATAESEKGALVLSRRSSDCSDWPARSRPGESGGGAMAQGGDMTLCSGTSPEEAKRMRRLSGARTWQWPFPRASRFLSGDLPCRGRDGD